jgi:hypothetical protein
VEGLVRNANAAQEQLAFAECMIGKELAHVQYGTQKAFYKLDIHGLMSALPAKAL